jgi:hypothetical protein
MDRWADRLGGWEPYRFQPAEAEDVGGEAELESQPRRPVPTRYLTYICERCGEAARWPQITEEPSSLDYAPALCDRCWRRDFYVPEAPDNYNERS